MASFTFFVAKRLALPKSRLHSKGALRVQVVVVAASLMALITVMSVMSGFQASFIRAICQVQSYDLTISSDPAPLLAKNPALNSKINSITPFIDATALFSSTTSSAAVILRYIDINDAMRDEGFMSELKIFLGAFCSRGSVVIGSILADTLGLTVGDVVSANVLNENIDDELLSEEVFTVAGIFETGYYPLNETYAFTSLDESSRAPTTYGIKLQNPKLAPKAKQLLTEAFAPAVTVLTAADQNRAFFRALKTEKLVLTLVMTLILIVVSINIYNNTRRAVFMKQSDIAIMESFGVGVATIRLIFLVRALIAAFIGGLIGVALGVAVSCNMTRVFAFLASLPTPLSDMFFLYSTIKSVTMASDVLFFLAFCLASSVAGAFFATSAVSSKAIKEVLHND